MQCADFKVRLRLWSATFLQAKWLEYLPKDYAAYLDFYQLANNKHESGMAKARAGWVIINQERLWTQAFQPTLYANEKAQGTLVHLHGYYDHGASYPSLQRWALKNKLYYLTTDLLGHGLSSGERASVNSFTDYQKILTALIEILTINAMPKPWLLSGFSTGGAIALEHQLTVSKFDATVLFAPLIRPVAWQAKLVKWLGLLRLLIKNLPRKFTANSNDAAFLKFVQQQDCLQSKQLPLAWIIALGRWIVKIESTKPSDIDVLIIQGDADSTVDWHYNLPVLNRLLPKSTTKMIEGGAHQLLNDGQMQRLKVFEYLDEWLIKIKEKELP